MSTIFIPRPLIIAALVAQSWMLVIIMLNGAGHLWSQLVTLLLG
ncbi:hypothetical protein [Devosia sp.]